MKKIKIASIAALVGIVMAITGEYTHAADFVTDKASWLLVSTNGGPPSARRGHSAVYDSASNTMIVFGGTDSGYKNDVWKLNLNTNEWSSINASPDTNRANDADGVPNPRATHSAVWTGSDMIIFGGWNHLVDGAVYRDVWVLKNALGGSPQWERKGVAPTPFGYGLRGSSAVWTGTKMIIFGGMRDDEKVFNRVMSYTPSSNTWEDSLDGGIGARYEHSAVYDSNSDSMFVFGGRGVGHAVRNDVWKLTDASSGSRAWTRLIDNNIEGSPNRRAGHSAFFDTTNSQMLVFGGITAGGNRSEDVWALKTGDLTWSRVFPSGVTPGIRSDQAGIYDGVDDIIIFGGDKKGAGNYGDTWKLNFVVPPVIDPRIDPPTIVDFKPICLGPNNASVVLYWTDHAGNGTGSDYEYYYTKDDGLGNRVGPIAVGGSPRDPRDPNIILFLVPPILAEGGVYQFEIGHIGDTHVSPLGPKIQLQMCSPTIKIEPDENMPVVEVGDDVYSAHTGVDPIQFLAFYDADGSDNSSEPVPVTYNGLTFWAENGDPFTVIEIGDKLGIGSPCTNGADLSDLRKGCVRNRGIGGSAGFQATRDGITDTATIQFGNQSPIATGFSVSTNEDTALAINMRDYNSDGTLESYDFDTHDDGSLEYLIMSGPTNGSLSGSGSNRIYTPTSNYNGSDSFTFKVKDIHGGESETVTVVIAVDPANDTPVASCSISPSSVATDIDFTADGSVSSDIDGDVLEVCWDWDNDGNCETSFNSLKTQIHSYSTSGNKTVGMKAKDSSGATNSATCNVTVTTPPAGPDLITYSLSVSPSSSTVGDLLTFSGIVKNQGETGADASKTTLSVDGDGDVNSDGNYYNDPSDFSSNNATGDLATGVTEMEVWTDAWTATAGAKKFKICADTDNEVTEDNETNNCSEMNFSVSSTPTLAVDLSASATSGVGSVNTTLTADATGTATGNIKYYFWWNCASNTTDLSIARGDCGAENVASGLTAVDPYTTPSYTYTSSSTAKVLIERQGLFAQDTLSISVSADPCVPDNNAPTAFNLFSPANGVTGLGYSITLQWNTSSDPDDCSGITYDVYVSADDNVIEAGDYVNSTNSTFYVYSANRQCNVSTEYYWQIVARDANGNSTSSAVWKFETGPLGSDYSIGINPSIQTANPGDARVYNISISPQCGYNNPVAVSINSVISSIPGREGGLLKGLSTDNVSYGPGPVTLNPVGGVYPTGYLKLADGNADDVRGYIFTVRIFANGSKDASPQLYINQRPNPRVITTATSPFPGAISDPPSGVNPLTVKFSDNNSDGGSVDSFPGNKIAVYVADLDGDMVVDRCFSTVWALPFSCNNGGSPISPSSWNQVYNDSTTAIYGVFDDLFDNTGDPLKSFNYISKPVSIVNVAPVAHAGISRDSMWFDSGVINPLDFKSNITVPLGEDIPLNFAAWRGTEGSPINQSTDLNGTEAFPNQWSHNNMGMNGANNGKTSKCDWNIDFDSNFGDQITDNPINFRECSDPEGDGANYISTNHTFTTPGNNQMFQVLRMTDRGTATSDAWADPDLNGTVKVNVKPVLTAVAEGSGNGVVTSAPAGIPGSINCSTAGHTPITSDCRALYDKNQGVTLTALADPPGPDGLTSVFKEWRGDAASCGSSFTCTLIMTSNKKAIAIFNKPSLTILPHETILRIGQTFQFEAFYDPDGSCSDGCETAEERVTSCAGVGSPSPQCQGNSQWGSSNNGVLTLIDRGFVEGKARGSAKVSIEYDQDGNAATPPVRDESEFIKIIRYKWEER